MEQKNLRKTAGGPLYFGLAAALLLVADAILLSGVQTALMNAQFAANGINVTLPPAFTAIGSVIGLLIYPGIFLILLLVSVNRPKRGTAFCIVWAVLSGIAVLSGLSVLSGIANLFMANTGVMAQSEALTNQLVPGGYPLVAGLGLAGSACILISCILLLIRLNKSELPEAEPAADIDDAADQVNP